VPPQSAIDRRAAIRQLRDALVAGRNTDAGWGYYAGKASRLEPTCWALLALGSDEGSRALRESASRWVAQCQRPAGSLVENPDWPTNIAFNALAAFAMLNHPDGAGDEARRRLLAFVLASKGEPAPASASMRQDNSLQGWSWMDATFSWVEPTCWGMLALIKARGAGISSPAAQARIGEAQRLLIDRACQPGGWNFGNATVMGQDLRAYAPTTALGLLAMQDLRDHDVVVRGLAALETLWPEEVSTTTLALSTVCLGVYGRPVGPLVARLIEHTPRALAFGNHHGLALALFALSSLEEPHAFRL